jgi:hypothetical protein
MSAAPRLPLMAVSRSNGSRNVRALPQITGLRASMFAGSGAEFSLRPPDPATGSFAKALQCMPVKTVSSTDIGATLTICRPSTAFSSPGRRVLAGVEAAPCASLYFSAPC